MPPRPFARIIQPGRRGKALKPLLAAAQEIVPTHGGQNHAPSIATTRTCGSPCKATFINWNRSLTVDIFSGFDIKRLIGGRFSHHHRSMSTLPFYF
jgi:hypothetical protein